MDIEKLKSRLPLLTGRDFEQAELADRVEGNTFPEITFSKSFQARLAAHALEVPYDDIKNLPIKEYQQICAAVFGFLFNSAPPVATQ